VFLEWAGSGSMQSSAAGIGHSWEHGFECTWGMESSLPESLESNALGSLESSSHV